VASVIARRIIDGRGVGHHGSRYAFHGRTKQESRSARLPAACSLRRGHPDRCRSLPIPLTSRRSDTGTVCTYPPPPLAASSRITKARRPDDDERPSTAERDVPPPSGWPARSTAVHASRIPVWPGAPGDQSASGDALASVSLDRFLDLVHREDLSPVDLRVLLRVTDREATVRELANSMGQPPIVLRRASARLVARGLLRRRRRPTRHHRLEVTLATTATGMGALCRVTQALGVDLAVPATPLELPDRPANKVHPNGDAAGPPSAATPPPSETGVRAG
jgi:DNA-binding MarR family transcriptional regulator